MRIAFEAKVFGIGLALAVVVIAFLGVWPPFVITATKYSPGFSESAFEQIKIGDPTNQVQKLLGEPIWRQTSDSGTMWWRYSQERWGLICYRHRMIVFSNNVVADKIRELNRD